MITFPFLQFSTYTKLSLRSAFTPTSESSVPAHSSDTIRHKLIKRNRPDWNSLPSDFVSPSSNSPYGEAIHPPLSVASISSLPISSSSEFLSHEPDPSEENSIPPQLPRRPRLDVNLISRWSQMDVSDEILISHLAELKKNGVSARQSDNDDIEREEEKDGLTDDSSEEQYQEDERNWKKAWTGLFCCRELIRTELNYLDGLLQLELCESQRVPPSILARYLPELVSCSIQLSISMLSDPTAYGISSSFVDAENQMEKAFVAWCGIIGQTFAPERQDWSLRDRASSFDSPNKLVRRSQTISGGSMNHNRQSHSSAHGFPILEANRHRSDRRHSVGKSTDSTIRLFKRLSLPWSYNSPRALTPDLRPATDEYSTPETDDSLSSAPLSSRSLKNSNTFASSLPGSPQNTTPCPSSYRRLRPAPSIRDDGAKFSRNRASCQTSRVADVKDLAIQPTQRLTRYPLLYRDLLHHTSDETVKFIVQRALESATRIATKCNQAQTNTAFLRSS